MLTFRGDFCSFFPEKRTKNLVALKTRLLKVAFVWLPGMLARFDEFHVLFLSLDEPYSVLLLHETGQSGGSDSLARQFLLIEMIYKNLSLKGPL